MTTETTPRRVATRTRLIEAAIEEFGERGIDATSVEQLCERAGFSRGAFYSNFQTKDDLCIEVLAHIRDRMVAGLRETFAVEQAMDLDWALNTALPAFFEAMGPDTNSRLTMVEIRLRGTRVPALRERQLKFAAETNAMLIGALSGVIEHLGLRFRLPVSQVIDVATAIYLDQLLDDARDNSLLTTTIAALVED